MPFLSLLLAGLFRLGSVAALHNLLGGDHTLLHAHPVKTALASRGYLLLTTLRRATTTHAGVRTPRRTPRAPSLQLTSLTTAHSSTEAPRPTKLPNWSKPPRCCSRVQTQSGFLQTGVSRGAENAGSPHPTPTRDERLDDGMRFLRRRIPSEKRRLTPNSPVELELFCGPITPKGSLQITL